MAQDTTIEWTDKSWNFLRGCSRVSEGCEKCYAELIAARFSGEGLAYHGLATMKNGKPRWTGKISFVPDVILAPLQWRRPSKIFVNSMSDLFHKNVSDEWIDKAFAVMALCQQHTFQILTKRPERMLQYLTDPKLGNRIAQQIRRYQLILDKPTTSAFPVGSPTLPLPNVWLGVSVEDQKTAAKRIPLLVNMPAAVRFVSAEPLLGPIDFYKAADGAVGKGIDLVIVGGESGNGARPMEFQWTREIFSWCSAAGAARFFKQAGAVLSKKHKMSSRKGSKLEEIPPDLAIRELPPSKPSGIYSQNRQRIFYRK